MAQAPATLQAATKPALDSKQTTTPPEPSLTKPTLQELLEQFVQVKALADPSSHFSHEGVCTKCGWHSLQMSDKAARQLVQQHVQNHWRDVVAQTR
jgi:hypothetical protein